MSATGGKTAFTRLQHVIPQHALSRLVHAVTRIEQPWLKNWAIKRFVHYFDVDLSDAARTDIGNYASFNDFFTRELAQGARDFSAPPDAILSPCDGTVSQSGHIDGDQALQAKGRHFSISALLASEDGRHGFDGGSFATLYLAPYNYHRIHMPLAGTLTGVTLVPGRLFSVNRATAEGVSRLYCRNERVVCTFDTRIGAMALVLVGALNVGSIETVWAGEITPGGGRRVRRWNGTEQRGIVNLERGEEMGRFNMGSTVIAVFEANRLDWLGDIVSDRTVLAGEPLAKTR